MFNDPRLIIPYGHKVTNIPKVVAEDTTLTVTNADGGKTTFPVVSGTEINLHVPGLHYNRTLSGIVSQRLILMKFLSAVLEESPQVHAREIPW